MVGIGWTLSEPRGPGRPARLREAQHIGELAHIISASMEGPRADEGPELTEGERALPENVVVLCHTVVDKATDEYPANVLRGWKQDSQEARAVAYGTPVFTSRSEAREFVGELLGANRAVFDLYGRSTRCSTTLALSSGVGT